MKLLHAFLDEPKLDAVVLRAIKRLGDRSVRWRIRMEIERAARAEIPAALVYSSVERLLKRNTLGRVADPTRFGFRYFMTGGASQ